MNFKTVSVLVVGDAMLDIYCEGTVSRVSPEAPVPVVLLKAERAVPGGAANVAANIAALGARADLVCVLGADGHAAWLRTLMHQNFATVSLDHMIETDDRPTTTKTRIIGNAAQVVRLDREQAGFIDIELEDALLARVAARLPACDTVILSDYAKGVCSDRVITEVIRLARAAGKPLLVDPKRRDFSIYRGATIIKPNTRELEAASGLPCGDDAGVEAAAARVTAMTGAALIVTRSERGMSYCAADGALHIPTVARKVFDVSGAGDTVIAALALALRTGETPAHALAYANAAAAVVVGKVGTATVTHDEVEQEIARARPLRPASQGKIVDRARARDLAALWRAEGHVIGFTNGCFDLLHPGHVDLLEQSAAQCDRLIVALNTDASVRRLKGPTRPVQTQAARATLMAALGMVDMVVLFDEDTPREIIADLRPDVLVKGADYTLDTVVGADLVMAGGGRVHLARLVPDNSTTGLIARMNRPALEDHVVPSE